jgi:hypothetical protein
LLLDVPSKKARALKICGKIEKNKEYNSPDEIPARALKKKLLGSWKTSLSGYLAANQAGSST